ncbi:MAG: BLUF domain-containing protein [Burkholderiales bacterium]
MIRLLYFSQATQPTSGEAVEDILQSSRTNNLALDITGVLVHGGGLFMQTLEGPEENVLPLYVKIMRDPRHENCSLVHISHAEKRLFQKWSMGVIESDPLMRHHVMRLHDQRTETVPAKIYTDTMREFLKRLNASR